MLRSALLHCIALHCIPASVGIVQINYTNFYCCAATLFSLLFWGHHDHIVHNDVLSTRYLSNKISIEGSKLKRSAWRSMDGYAGLAGHFSKLVRA